jgi:hypothetical protein
VCLGPKGHVDSPTIAAGRQRSWRLISASRRDLSLQPPTRIYTGARQLARPRAEPKSSHGNRAASGAGILQAHIRPAANIASHKVSSVNPLLPPHALHEDSRHSRRRPEQNILVATVLVRDDRQGETFQARELAPEAAITPGAYRELDRGSRDRTRA